MTIVTLTTDFGNEDYYAAVIKGALLEHLPDVQVIDVTHQISLHDIVKAAFILKNTYPSFPKGSIHILSVNNFYTSGYRFLLVEKDDHYFIGPDNGVFSILFNDLPEIIRLLPYKNEGHFPLKKLYAETVSQLSQNGDLSKIGTKAESVQERITLQPVIGPSQIRGSVIHIDNYENAVFNITEELFHRVCQRRPFLIFFKRNDPISSISNDYSDVGIGETLCVFNSAGYLEISVNMGKAASLWGLQQDDTIQIDFKND